MSLLLNLLWILFGGLWMALGWLLAALIMAVTIIGLPWAFAAFRIARYTLLPFGHTVVSRDELTNTATVGTGALGFLGNLIWLLLAGWWLALGHLITAVAWAITIVGLPFSWAHLKLAGSHSGRSAARSFLSKRQDGCAARSVCRCRKELIPVDSTDE